MELAVVDAGAALTIVLPGEAAVTGAVRLFEAFHAGDLGLCAPTLWQYEVANVLRHSVPKRLTREQADGALHMLFGWGILLREFGPLAERAWALAHRLGTTVYDASYLALAEDQDTICYTADRRLERAARATGLVRWIGEFA